MQTGYRWTSEAARLAHERAQDALRDHYESYRSRAEKVDPRHASELQHEAIQAAEPLNKIAVGLIARETVLFMILTAKEAATAGITLSVSST